MLKSEEVKAKLEATKAEYDREYESRVRNNPENTPANTNKVWSAFWIGCGNHLMERIQELEHELRKELNREIKVGDGVTLHLWSDAEAHTVIGRTAKTLTIQRDKATPIPGFRPEWVPGGFSAICTNSEDQEWTYERDPNGAVTKCHWSEKYGRWQAGSDGSLRVSRGRREYYDYNF